MKKFRIMVVVLLIAVLATACAPVATEAPKPTVVMTEAPKTIVDIAVADGRFKTLVTALQAADLVETLQGAGPFTVFAPTDDAFAKIPAETLNALLADKAKLTEVLLYHVVSGNVKAADVVKLTEAETVAGKKVMIRVEGDKVFVNDSQVIITDIAASNGTIHVIDTVLLPKMDIAETAIADGRFKTLVTALQAADLVETLKGAGPFTVFAPTDDAFAKIPAETLTALLADKAKLTEVLLYHVVAGNVKAADVVKLTEAETVAGKKVMIRVEGDKVFVNDSQVIITDIETSNGTIHVIDTVLLPKMDIVETAIADGRFKTLVTALQAAELVDTLKGAGPFTVFAPTDDAFAKLPAGTVEKLLKDIPTLKNILLYHVVSGNVKAADVVKLTEAETVLGQKVTIKVDGNKVFINGSQVIITDIETSNGTIHVIDTVLLPK
ncbi:MAG: fasciclin domain-containing protein [Syntrophaceae bacterium]|nr:fasciclin domain-containing protein [Anaerolineaceae bacterium]NTW77747.1 fasciclin domain-containing protein [Syntrophaceae bacterium]